MTDAERTFFLRAHRRLSGLQPDVERAILRALQIIRDSMTDSQLADFIASGQFDTLLNEVYSDTLINRATIDLRTRIRRVADRSFQYTTADLPSGGMVSGTIGVSFDYLRPKVVAALAQLNTKVVQGLAADIRETVRQTIQAGLEAGKSPRVVAAGLRDVIGLAPNQAQWVRDYRTKLEMAHLPDSGALDNLRRDRRFDATIRRSRKTGEPIPSEKIDVMEAAYRKRMIALNAETHARTATLDAYKLGQRLAWEDAITQGIVPRDRLTKTWIGVMDDRERPEHVAMEDETVLFDLPFTNGEMIPGDSTYNCRCLARYRVA